MLRSHTQLLATPLHSMNISIITESSRLQLGEQGNVSSTHQHVLCDHHGVWHIAGAQGIFIGWIHACVHSPKWRVPLPVKDPFQMPPLSWRLKKNNSNFSATRVPTFLWTGSTVPLWKTRLAFDLFPGYLTCYSSLSPSLPGKRLSYFLFLLNPVFFFFFFAKFTYLSFIFIGG